MSGGQKNTLRNFLIHAVGVIIFIGFAFILSPDLTRSNNLFTHRPFLRDLVAYLLLTGIFYINYFFLVPKFFFTRRYLLFGLILFGLFLAVSLIPELLFAGFRPMRGAPRPGGPMHFHPPSLLMIYLRHLPSFLMVTAFASLIRISARWRDAERQKTAAELSYLKAQVNPHFLFNTLNSIYALTIEKSDAAPEAVVKLSGMMRYVLNETQRDFVSLEQEVEYITDYIGLQKIRLGETVPMEYVVKGAAAGKRIAPMLLIPFVENAFKYGVNAEENCNIRISISIEGDRLLFESRNNKVYTRPSIEKRSSLGIRNTRERLEMLYPGNYSLNVLNEEKEFIVTLALQLV